MSNKQEDLVRELENTLKEAKEVISKQKAESEDVKSAYESAVEKRFKPTKEWGQRSKLYKFFAFFGHVIFNFEERKFKTSFLLAISQLWIMSVITYIIASVISGKATGDIVWKVVVAITPGVLQLAIHVFGILHGKKYKRQYGNGTVSDQASFLNSSSLKQIYSQFKNMK